MINKSYETILNLFIYNNIDSNNLKTCNSVLIAL